MGLTHLSRLLITPTAGKGDATTDKALEIDSTRVSSGYAAFFTGVGKVHFAKWSRLSVYTGGGSAIAGRRAITTGGSGVVSTKRITGTAMLFLTPLVNTGIANVCCYEKRSVRVAGTSFKIVMKSATQTALTGSVNWMIVASSAAAS